MGEGAPTQRVLAERLGVTEPSTSRMVAVLREQGLLDVSPDPAGGNRRRLALTPIGKARVQACRDLLEARFAEVVASARLPYAAHAEHTRALITALDAAESRADS